LHHFSKPTQPVLFFNLRLFDNEPHLCFPTNVVFITATLANLHHFLRIQPMPFTSFDTCRFFVSGVFLSLAPVSFSEFLDTILATQTSQAFQDFSAC
jgi:hypothetical protein